MGYLETAEQTLASLRGHAATTPGRQELRQPRTDAASQAAGLSPQQVALLTLDQFARSGLKLRFHSRVLGSDVLFAADDVPDSDIEAKGIPVYRVYDLKKLAIMKPQPRSLRCIHEAKAIFNGTVEDVKDLG